jgi:anti-sigma B factor antagonist
MTESPDETKFDAALSPFQCDVFYADGRAIVSVRGEVDVATAPALLNESLAALTLPITAVRIDLRHCTFLDSSGIGALLSALRMADEQDIAFSLASVPGQVLRVIEATGLTEMFGVTTDVADEDPPLAAER